MARHLPARPHPRRTDARRGRCAKYEIYRIIRQLAAEGTAILLISSELPELTGLADRIIVMHEGTQSATLAQADFNPQTIMAAATGQLNVSPSP